MTCFTPYLFRETIPTCSSSHFSPFSEKENWVWNALIPPPVLSCYWLYKSYPSNEWSLRALRIKKEKQTLSCIIIIVVNTTTNNITINIKSFSAHHEPGTMLSILDAPPQLCKNHAIIPIFHMSSENFNNCSASPSFEFQMFNLILNVYESNLTGPPHSLPQVFAV